MRPAVGAAPVSCAWAWGVRSAPIAAGERIQVIGGLLFTEGERSRVREQLAPGGYNEGQLDDDRSVLNPIDEGLN